MENKKRVKKLFLVGFAIYVISIIWINFNCAQWYNFDMYSDSLITRFMSEKNTFFPDNWVFGNQFYIVETCNLASLFFSFLNKSVLSISFAATIYMFMIFAAFLWTIRENVTGETLAVGLFCISGAVLISSSASQDIEGMQLFYSMTSYYACYVFCILITLGMYLRYKFSKQIKAGIFLLLFSALLNFALGMQSLRETVVLNVPLVMIELFSSAFQKKVNKHSMTFALSMLIVNLFGMVFAKIIGANNAPIINEISFSFKIGSVMQNFCAGIRDLAMFSGLRFFNESIKWWPLAFCGIFFWVIVVFSIALIVKKRDFSPMSVAVVFSALSIICVLGIASLAFRTRPIYYFVWFLQVVFSICYILENIEKKTIKMILIIAIAICGVINYVYNFYPDIKKYKEQTEYYEGVVNRLLDENINCIYTDIATQPTIAAYSKDRIVSGTFEYDYNKSSGYLLKPVDTLKPKDFFENQEEYNSYIVLSNGIYGSTPSFEMMSYGGVEYSNELMSKLMFVREEVGEYTTFYIYKFQSGILGK